MISPYRDERAALEAMKERARLAAVEAQAMPASAVAEEESEPLSFACRANEKARDDRAPPLWVGVVFGIVVLGLMGASMLWPDWPARLWGM